MNDSPFTIPDLYRTMI